MKSVMLLKGDSISICGPVRLDIERTQDTFDVVREDGRVLLSMEKHGDEWITITPTGDVPEQTQSGGSVLDLSER